ncbi:MAG: hydroxypyruvate isomerase [Thermodesulfobacteriota bacterium]|nr:hydroxypyruvate isomerase [Thermodesulfobacteriota bacterium]
MLKFSVNLTMLFNEVDFLDRFERAARAGFKGVEYMAPYGWKKEQLAEKLNKHGLVQVLFNLPAGDSQAGERGMACIPGREVEFQEGVERAIEYAKALKCSLLNCLAGKRPQGVSSEKIRQTLVDNLRFAAKALDKEGIRLLVEPLNQQDVPGFSLVHTQDALQLFEEVGHPNLWIQYDIYHMQIMEGNLTKTILSNLSRIGHIQLADNPGRHEPGTGEINFTNLFRFIDEAGYDGWMGCEYIRAGKTEDGLKWIKPYLK